MYEKKLILDTCALLWLASDNKALSQNAIQSIENASIVYVSAISAWEISLKSIQGALKLPIDSEKWFNLVLKNHNLILAPLDPNILIAANHLPLHHKDPADRFIIATAMRENAVIVTADQRFNRYDVKTII